MGFLSTLLTFFAWVGGGTSTMAVIRGVVYVATLAVGVKGYLQTRAMLAKGQDIMANKIAAGGKLPVIYGHCFK